MVSLSARRALPPRISYQARTENFVGIPPLNTKAEAVVGKLLPLYSELSFLLLFSTYHVSSVTRAFPVATLQKPLIAPV